MVDLLLLAGRLLLVALLYLFLFFVVKTGVGLVRGPFSTLSVQDFSFLF